MKFLLICLSLLCVQTALAQRQSIDLRDRDTVPLYDCSIFESRRDQDACYDLRDSRVSDNGEAVSCRVFNRRDERTCQRLAESITYNDYAFRCRGDNRCERVRNSYASGFINIYVPAPRPRTEVVTTTSTSVVRNDPVFVHNTCGADAYDRAQARWEVERKKLRNQGRDRAILGGAIAIGGLILGGSDSRTNRAIGGAMTIGGTYVLAHGLVEMAVADTWYPHLDPICGGHYLRETRRVVVEERQCTSTRYTENGWGSSRSYYEVNCQNKRYVTYERFDAFESSSYVVTSSYNY